MKQKTLVKGEGDCKTKSWIELFYTFIIKPSKRFVNMGRPKPKTASWDEIKKYFAITTIAVSAFVGVLFSIVAAIKILW